MSAHNEQAPAPFGQIIDDAADADREWFERHPFATERVRRLVPGEFWPFAYAENARVHVRQIEPGIRARHPLASNCGAYDLDAAARMQEHVAEAPEWLRP